MNFKNWDRFDMGTFHHFNQSHNFFADDYDSAAKFDERQSEDIGSLLNLCNLQPEDFSAGWSRLDATRGKDLVLEVSHRANDRYIFIEHQMFVSQMLLRSLNVLVFVKQSYPLCTIHG